MVVRSCSRRRIRGQLRWGWGEGGLCRGQAALRGRVRHSELVPAHACCSSCGRVRHSELVPPSHATLAVRPRHRRACRFRRGGGSGVLTSGRPSWSRRRAPAFSSCGSPTRRSPRRGARPWTCRRSSSRTGSSCGSPRAAVLGDGTGSGGLRGYACVRKGCGSGEGDGRCDAWAAGWCVAARIWDFDVCISTEAGASLAFWKPAEALVQVTDCVAAGAEAVCMHAASAVVARRAAMQRPCVHVPHVRTRGEGCLGAKRARRRARRASSSRVGSGLRARSSWRASPARLARMFDARGRRARGQR